MAQSDQKARYSFHARNSTLRTEDRLPRYRTASHQEAQVGHHTKDVYLWALSYLRSSSPMQGSPISKAEGSLWRHGCPLHRRRNENSLYCTMVLPTQVASLAMGALQNLAGQYECSHKRIESLLISDSRFTSDPSLLYEGTTCIHVFITLRGTDLPNHGIIVSMWARGYAMITGFAGCRRKWYGGLKKDVQGSILRTV
ncbi:hypothetical protein BC629DRAFT_1528928 [Irpex lacteus]|nr:hypothetical protein BC629DRAFT_1528928 [Irpex lacteus]